MNNDNLNYALIDFEYLIKDVCSKVWSDTCDELSSRADTIWDSLDTDLDY